MHNRNLFLWQLPNSVYFYKKKTAYVKYNKQTL